MGVYPATLRISAQDEEIPRSAQFNSTNDKLFTISQNGLFCVWDLKTLQKVYLKQLLSPTKFMIVCKNTPRIIIALENEIQVFKNKDPFLQENKYYQKYATSILQMKMSDNEKFLAVAVAPQSD